MARRRALLNRWLGVGLASALAVATLALAVTGRFALYVNPGSTWFAVGMAVVLLVGAAASFALPLGSEGHHDHGDDHGHGGSGGVALAATASGGVVATGVVLAILVVPPASLSAELAMSRDVGAPPLFAGSDAVALAATGDTATFGLGEWAGVFASATDPDAFVGDRVTLTGFVTPATADSGFRLTRLVVTHCVIDAQPASVPVDTAVPVPDVGQWVTVTGTIRPGADGRLELSAADVSGIPEPEDPYEY